MKATTKTFLWVQGSKRALRKDEWKMTCDRFHSIIPDVVTIQSGAWNHRDVRWLVVPHSFAESHLILVPHIEQACEQHSMTKWSHDLSRQPIIRLPITQIEKYPCGTIGPRLHPSSMVNQLLSLPSIRDRHQASTPDNCHSSDTFAAQLNSLVDSQSADEIDHHAFESIVHWQHQPSSMTNAAPNRLQYMRVLDPLTQSVTRGRQYPILADEIDLMDDPTSCAVIREWAFAHLVRAERQKFIDDTIDDDGVDSRKRTTSKRNIRVYLRKRPLTPLEETVFKEVDIISIVGGQTVLLHIPSITIDNQVFVKNRSFRCDRAFDAHCQMSTIYHSTLAPLLDQANDGAK